MEISEDILEARTFLEKAEKESDPAKKFEELKEGIDLLDAYIEENPDISEKTKTYIANMRRSHTRRLLSQLLSINQIEIDIWFDYAILLTSRLKMETEYAIENNAKLKKNYNEFLRVYSEDLRRIAKKYKNKL